MLKELALGDPEYYDDSIAYNISNYRKITTYLLKQGANPILYFSFLTGSGCGYYPEILETVLEFYGPERMDIYLSILEKDLMYYLGMEIKQLNFQFKRKCVRMSLGAHDAAAFKNWKDSKWHIEQLREGHRLLAKYMIDVIALKLGEQVLRKTLQKIGVPKILTKNWIFR